MLPFYFRDLNYIPLTRSTVRNPRLIAGFLRSRYIVLYTIRTCNYIRTRSNKRALCEESWGPPVMTRNVKISTLCMIPTGPSTKVKSCRPPIITPNVKTITLYMLCIIITGLSAKAIETTWREQKSGEWQRERVERWRKVGIRIYAIRPKTTCHEPLETRWTARIEISRILMRPESTGPTNHSWSAEVMARPWTVWNFHVRNTAGFGSS